MGRVALRTCVAAEPGIAGYRVAGSCRSFRGSGVRATWQRYADPLRSAKTPRGQRALSLHLQPYAALMRTRDDCVGLRASKPLVGRSGHHVLSL
jgi:hypothetical protein